MSFWGMEQLQPCGLISFCRAFYKHVTNVSMCGMARATLEACSHWLQSSQWCRSPCHLSSMQCTETSSPTMMKLCACWMVSSEHWNREMHNSLLCQWAKEIKTVKWIIACSSTKQQWAAQNTLQRHVLISQREWIANCICDCCQLALSLSSWLATPRKFIINSNNVTRLTTRMH